MSNKRRGKIQSEPQRWLLMGFYPLALAVIVLFVAIFGFSTDVQAEEIYPATNEDFDIRDADEWLEKFNINDMENPIIPENLDEYLDIFGNVEDSEDTGDVPEPSKPEEKVNAEEAEKALVDTILELDEGGYYYFSTLDTEDRLLYAQIYDIYMGMKGLTSVSTSDEEKLSNINAMVTSDHPEIFYVSGYFKNRDTSGKYSFSGIYSYDEGEVISKRLMVENAANEIADDVPTASSEYEVAEYLYRYITQNTVYDLASEENQEITSVLLNNRSVCAGYAKTMQYLLQKCGIQAIYVTGTASGPHGWLIARIDGKYYQIDVTWGDRDTNDAVETDYSYLCLPSSLIGKNHTPDPSLPVPDCDSMDANFYVMEEFLVENLDDAVLQDIFDRSSLEYHGVVNLMASDQRTYKALLDYLFSQGKVYDFYYGDSSSFHSVSYYTNDDYYTISIYK